MAVNYDNLFENIGEFVQRINDYVGYYSDLDTDFSEINTELQGNGQTDVNSGVFTLFVGFKSNLLSWINAMKSKVTELIQNKSTILDQLPGLLGQTSLESVLLELYRDMVANSESIDASVVTVGSVTDSKTNANAGSLLASKVLDGYNSPHPGFIVNPRYVGIDSQLSNTSDTLVISCVSDSESGGATEGAETFQYGGKASESDRYHWNAGGSGLGSSVQPIQAGRILQNLEFENFTSNAPDNWTVNTGTAGTHIDDQTSTNVQRGTYSLKLLGDGALAAINISQALPSNGVNPLRRYMVGFWVKGNASLTTGTLTIQFEGTGYSATSGEKIEMDNTALAAATSYTWKYFWINMPAEVPDNMALVIKLTGTPSAHAIYIDGGGFAPATYFNGVCFALYAGSSKFLRGDRFSFDVTNDEAGVFQKFFRKAYGFQMPSVTDGSETNVDTLAT